MAKWLISFKNRLDREVYREVLESEGYYDDGLGCYISGDDYMQLCSVEALPIYKGRETYDTIIEGVVGHEYYARRKKDIFKTKESHHKKYKQLNALDDEMETSYQLKDGEIHVPSR